MLRFAILEHDWPSLHWDLLLERDGKLLSWRLPQEPVDFENMIIEANIDHRMIYLDYEGPVSGDRGTVKRWDAGELRWLGEMEFELTGGKITGSFSIANDQLRKASNSRCEVESGSDAISSRSHQRSVE